MDTTENTNISRSAKKINAIQSAYQEKMNSLLAEQASLLREFQERLKSEKTKKKQEAVPENKTGQ